MNNSSSNIKFAISFFLVMLSIFGCKQEKIQSIGVIDAKKTPTITSTNLDIRYYNDSMKQYRFKTPLMERYEITEEPYMEFTKGVYIETYNDSTRLVETMLEADYAHYNETKRLWEAKGNVEAKNASGKTLYTEQIFWDEKGKRIYSEVETRIVDGEEVTIGSSFESDDRLENVVFKRTKGRIFLDTTANKNPKSPDSLSVADSLAVVDSLSRINKPLESEMNSKNPKVIKPVIPK